jgi:hypothetical protein
VAWEVRVRAAIRDSLAHEPLRVVQSRVRVERREVEVVVVVLGQAADAEQSRARLDAEIRQASGVTPRLEILAVPDANAIAGLQSTLLKPQHVESLPLATPPPTPEEQLDSSRARVRATLLGLWPSDSVGVPIAVDVGTSENAPLRIRVVHLGGAVAADNVETIQKVLTRELERPVAIIDVAVPNSALTREDGDLPFVARTAAAVRAIVGIGTLSVCVIRPAEPERGRRTSKAEADLGRALDEVFAQHPRVSTLRGGPWRVSFANGPCRAPDTPEAQPGTVVPPT